MKRKRILSTPMKRKTNPAFAGTSPNQYTNQTPKQKTNSAVANRNPTPLLQTQTGNKGSQGSQGSKGSKGSQGSQGSKGSKGSKPRNKRNKPLNRRRLSLEESYFEDFCKTHVIVQSKTSKQLRKPRMSLRENHESKESLYFPDDCLLIVMKFLSIRDLARVRMVSREFEGVYRRVLDAGELRYNVLDWVHSPVHVCLKYAKYENVRHVNVKKRDMQILNKLMREKPEQFHGVQSLVYSISSHTNISKMSDHVFLSTIARKFPNLKRLTISGSHIIVDSELPNVSHLCLQRCAIARFGKSNPFPRLEELQFIDNFTPITTMDIPHREIKKLTIAGSNAVKDFQDLVSLLIKCKLVHLSLTEVFVSSLGISKISKICNLLPHLETLCIGPILLHSLEKNKEKIWFQPKKNNEIFLRQRITLVPKSCTKENAIAFLKTFCKRK